MALGEVQPKFGADNQELSTLYGNGIVSYGPEFDDVCTTLARLVQQTRVSERTPIMSVRRSVDTIRVVRQLRPRPALAPSPALRRTVHCVGLCFKLQVRKATSVVRW